MSKAMVIDDSQAIRTLTASILGDLGYDVRQAANGKDALALVEEDCDLSLFLVDWNMPEMSGLEFVKQVRGDIRYCRIPVMVFTTATGEGQMNRALEAGASECVMKPFTKQMIEEKLRVMGAIQ